MRFKTQLLAAALLLTALLSTVGQGSFQNLDFESPIPPLTPDASFQVPIANALPGWSGYIGTNQTDRVAYNTVSIGAAAISLQSSASTFPPIAGSYSAILQGQFNPNNVPGLMSAAIAQTGQIPAGSLSLRFFSGSEYMQATFAGQNIPLIQLDVAGGYLTVGGDISAFAGQIGELKFTMPSVATSFNIPYLDNIQFSNQPIPEPSMFGLFSLGALLLGWRFVRSRR